MASPGETPLDPKGITAITKAIQGAVDSVLSILQPGDLTHDQVIEKVADAIEKLKKPAALGGLGMNQGMGDMEGMAENASEGGSETGAGE